jgi:histone deacetylase 1/2
MDVPTDFHWVVVKHILRYLRGMVSHGLHITHSYSITLHDFMDANWVGSIDDRKSTSGYLVFFGHISIS